MKQLTVATVVSLLKTALWVYQTLEEVKHPEKAAIAAAAKAILDRASAPPAPVGNQRPLAGS